VNDVTAEKWPHTGAVLMGGESTRMGVPKEDLQMVDGRTMLETVVQTMEEVCVRVITVGGEERRGPHVPDIRRRAGPLGGIEALLASGMDEEYLVCPSDIPMISQELIRRLTTTSEAVATIFEVEGDPVHSLPLRVSTAALDSVTSALDAGENAVHLVLARFKTERISISREEAAGLRNINSPDDYRRLATDN
jgi:molybdopterin-guanine dinucleotide biosynthesis protein A